MQTSPTTAIETVSTAKRRRRSFDIALPPLKRAALTTFIPTATTTHTSPIARRRSAGAMTLILLSHLASPRAPVLVPPAPSSPHRRTARQAIPYRTPSRSRTNPYCSERPRTREDIEADDEHPRLQREHCDAFSDPIPVGPVGTDGDRRHRIVEEAPDLGYESRAADGWLVWGRRSDSRGVHHPQHGRWARAHRALIAGSQTDRGSGAPLVISNSSGDRGGPAAPCDRADGHSDDRPQDRSDSVHEQVVRVAPATEDRCEGLYDFDDSGEGHRTGEDG